jgi:hypothetical protein
MVAKLPSQAPEADSTYETGGEGCIVVFLFHNYFSSTGCATAALVERGYEAGLHFHLLQLVCVETRIPS